MSQVIWWLNRGQYDFNGNTHEVTDRKLPQRVMYAMSRIGCLYTRAFGDDTGDIWTYSTQLKTETVAPWTAHDSPFKQYLRHNCAGLVVDILDAEALHDWPGIVTDFRHKRLDRVEIRELARCTRQQQQAAAT